jgi:hypothetical protein
MTNKSEEVRKLRMKMGCGLREAFDAVNHYGSSDAAINALSASTSNPDDPFARAVRETDRWRAKACAYKDALTQIQNCQLKSSAEFMRHIADEGITQGDKL